MFIISTSGNNSLQEQGIVAVKKLIRRRCLHRNILSRRGTRRATSYRVVRPWGSNTSENVRTIYTIILLVLVYVHGCSDAHRNIQKSPETTIYC